MTLAKTVFVCALALTAGTLPSPSHAQAPAEPPAGAVRVDASAAGRRQVIDGFGTALTPLAQEAWFQQLYFDDLQASIVRMDMTPRFASPYSDSLYYSPWFGSQIAFPGPDGNNARTYTSPSDYSREFGGFRAPIAVMGPDIDANVAKFDFSEVRPATGGSIARAGLARRAALGDFKLLGSTFSPAPWLKVASGSTFDHGEGVLPTSHTPWPFIWNGQFGGGNLDVSGVPLEVFHDGTGPTSALTQYARSTAAYLRGFQRAYGVPLYAVSIQNEVNFEEFYDSCAYPLASQLGAALKALRAELDKYDDLKSIRLIGPEDLLLDTPYAFWQFGGDDAPVHKNLRYLHELRATDPVALAALDFVAVHASVGDQAWRWWAEGWQTTPAGTLPARLDGFLAYGRRSWMTETSGGDQSWPTPETGSADSGALGMGIHIHRALTVGQQSAWLHWQFADGDPAGVFTLTDRTLGASAPKYVVAKHFFRAIRPNARRVEAQVAEAPGLLASAYLHEQERTITVVLINTAATSRSTAVAVDGLAGGEAVARYDSFSSSAQALWQSGLVTAEGGRAQVTVPAYGIVTLKGRIEAARPPCPAWLRRLGFCR